MKCTRFVMAMALAALPLCVATAKAADMPAAAPDCSTANTTLITMVGMPMPAMSSTDSLDKNFVMVMHMMSDHGMQMAKLEAACGKDAKTRDFAAKMVRDLQDDAAHLQMMQLQSAGG